MKIHDVHKSFIESYRGMTATDWCVHLTDFLAAIEGFQGDEFEERSVSGWVAALCERAYYAVVHNNPRGDSSLFERNLFDMLSHATLPRCLIECNLVLAGKRQPSLMGSIKPTLDRFGTLESLSGAFGESIDAIVLGGSMSYVPFLGVRDDHEGRDHSDIDLIIVQSDAFFEHASWRSFETSDLFTSERKRAFIDRVDEYRGLLSSDRADMLSQRFEVVGKPYTISIHFMTRSNLERLVDVDLCAAIDVGHDVEYPIYDYRSDRFDHPCQARIACDGSRSEIGVVSMNNSVRFGYVTMGSGFGLRDGVMYPGAYLTVISPAFNVFYERPGAGVGATIGVFERIMYETTKSMRARTPWASYAKAHNRYAVFCPGRYDEGKDSFVAPELAERFRRSDRFQMLGDDAESARLKRRLEELAEGVLRRMDEQIDSFIGSGGTTPIGTLPFNGVDWRVVATVPAQVSADVEEARGLLGGSYAMLPSDVMCRPTYSRLCDSFGKAFVLSRFDSVNPREPVEYSIIIKSK